MNKVSIITPNYNRADLIKETAASIFSQTSPDWEWVVVDDGSTDESLEVMRGFAAKDYRVKIFERNSQPKGAAACRNIAINNCSGNYLIFLDSDDILASFCIEQRLKAVEEHPDNDFLIFPLLLFKNKPDDMGLLWNVENDTDDLTRVMIGDPICQGSGTIWKKQSFIEIGKWDESLLLWQDVELHLRTFLQELKYRKLMDLAPDLFIRLSEVSLSRTGFNSLPKFKSRIKVYLDTVKNAADNKLLIKYRKGLVKMGFDLICSAIHNNFFSEANQLIKFCHSYPILDSPLRNKLQVYFWTKRFRLYKLPFFKSLSARPCVAYFSDYKATLNTIKYTGEIKL